MSGKLKLDLRFYPDRGIVDEAQGTQWSIYNNRNIAFVNREEYISESGAYYIPETIENWINIGDNAFIYSNDDLIFDPKGEDFTIDFLAFPGQRTDNKIQFLFFNYFDGNTNTVPIAAFGIYRDTRTNKMRYTICSTSSMTDDTIDNMIVLTDAQESPYYQVGYNVVSSNEFHHFAIDRYKDKICAFVDGVKDYEFTIPGQIPTPGSRKIAIGCSNGFVQTSIVAFYRFRYLEGASYYRCNEFTPPIPYVDFNRIIGNNIKINE